MSLTDNAAQLAADENAFRTGEPAPLPQAEDRAPMPDFDIPDPDPNGYEQIPALLAWLRVRADIKSIAKERVFAGQNWKFRGIDEALNAFGPVTLRHGVNVIPHRVEPTFRDARTSTNKPTRECTVTITWRIYGPMYDYFEAQTIGESLDSGDRGSSKAQAVARREILFGAGLTPTGEPDADTSTIERGDERMRSPQEYLGEIVDPNTSGARLQQISYELRQNRIDKAIMRNENGVDEPIGAMVTRIGNARFGAPAAPPSSAPAAQAASHGDHLASEWRDGCDKCIAASTAADQAAAS